VWVTAAVFVIGIALSLLYILVFVDDRITQSNVASIQNDMSLEQVSAILGPPTRRHAKSDEVTHTAFVTYAWDGMRGQAIVEFHKDGVIGWPKFIPIGNWWLRVKRFVGL
jgi:hypothetical protein